VSEKTTTANTKIVSVIGTRPQLVKAAVVTRAIRDDRRFDEVTVDTGQHYDHEMSALLLADLHDVHESQNLDIHGGTPTEMLARMIDGLGGVLGTECPDLVLVYGDTASTMAGALAASRREIPIAHVEAGLRSYNERMREEQIRVAVDRLADIRFCPTAGSVANLAAEGITDGVHHVGDVMFDAALAARSAVTAAGSDLLARLGVESGGYAVATVHRAETTDDPAQLGAVLDYLREVASEVPVVLPVHPRTRKAVDASARSLDGLIAIPPLGYLDMTRLVTGACAIYTDSGGLQKEAYFHRIPCVTLRPETEWVETIDAGWNRLWTVPDYAPRREITDYGDGNAGGAIRDVLAKW